MIFTNPIFSEMILPFLLVFVLVFAILQKSKILGEDKAQVDALISLVIGLILITVPFARDVVVNLMPWLAIGLAVMLVFMLLYGFVAGESASGQKWQKIVFGIIIGVFVTGIVSYESRRATWTQPPAGRSWPCSRTSTTRAEPC